MLVRDKRSLEFTVTRSLMKLLQTGSATVVSDCVNYLNFLPVSHQITISVQPNFRKISCVAKTIFAHCSKTKLTVT